METEQINRTEEEIKNFYANVLSYGYLDIKRAIEVFNEVGKNGDDLGEEVRQFSDDTGTGLEEVDVCFIAYETILQEARNKISEVLDFDFLNDGRGDIYTYGNYLCSMYDNTDDTAEEIKERLDKATEEQKNEILEDEPTKWFLSEIEVI